MDGKRVANFLLLRPAFSSRNLTSLALVALFFGVYVAAGGKVSSIPKLQTGNSFGGISIPDGAPTSDSGRAIDARTTETSAPAGQSKKPVKSLTADLFEDSTVTNTAKNSAKAKSTPEIAPAVEDLEPAADDDLAAIEKRVKRLKPKEEE